MTIKNGDTLAYDWPEDPEKPNEGILFDAVVMNPPYSLKNWNKSNLKVSDPRFEIAGVLPPNSKGDYAFLLHGLYHLGQKGTMAIVLPHGVLFRGGSEGEIRKRLLEKNQIDTIIGLPSSLFTNTGIPVVVLILKKNRELDAPVLMIDASKNFIKVGKQNMLLEKDIAKIVDMYIERKNEDGFSYLVSRDEIIENEYNMNIPRFVKAISEEVEHDVDAHLQGGIPIRDIKNLKVLNDVAKDILQEAQTEIRLNYVKLNTSIEELSNQILRLIDSKVTDKEGIQTLDTKTLRIIHQQIQELSDMGDNIQAELLKEFVNKELITGNLSSDFKFDDLFDKWKQEQLEKNVYEFATKWGIEKNLLLRTIQKFSLANKNVIPDIEDLTLSIDFNIARVKGGDSVFAHRMHVINTELPRYLAIIKAKYR